MTALNQSKKSNKATKGTNKTEVPQPKIVKPEISIYDFVVDPKSDRLYEFDEIRQAYIYREDEEEEIDGVYIYNSEFAHVSPEVVAKHVDAGSWYAVEAVTDEELANPDRACGEECEASLQASCGKELARLEAKAERINAMKEEIEGEFKALYSKVYDIKERYTKAYWETRRKNETGNPSTYDIVLEERQREGLAIARNILETYDK